MTRAQIYQSLRIQFPHVSRQRICQLTNNRLGLCSCCAKPAKRNYCDDCANRFKAAQLARQCAAAGLPTPPEVPAIKRHLNPEEWEAADWTLGNKALAAALGTCPATVGKHRPLFAPEHLRNPRPGPKPRARI
jgi:hypothetical protein